MCGHIQVPSIRQSPFTTRHGNFPCYIVNSSFGKHILTHLSARDRPLSYSRRALSVIELIRHGTRLVRPSQLDIAQAYSVRPSICRVAVKSTAPAHFANKCPSVSASSPHTSNSSSRTCCCCCCCSYYRSRVDHHQRTGTCFDG